MTISRVVPGQILLVEMLILSKPGRCRDAKISLLEEVIDGH